MIPPVPLRSFRDFWDLSGVASHFPILDFSIYSFESFQKPSLEVLKQRPSSDHKNKKQENSLQLSFHSKTSVLKESLPSDMSLESIHDSWFSPNGNNKNSWPGIHALSRSISVPPTESCLCQFLGWAHSVL